MLIYTMFYEVETEWQDYVQTSRIVFMIDYRSFSNSINKVWLFIQYSNNCLVPVGSFGSGPVAQLFAKAQHHSTSVQKMDGHLARQGDDKDNTERCVCVCLYVYSPCLVFLPVLSFLSNYF